MFRMKKSLHPFSKPLILCRVAGKRKTVLLKTCFETLAVWFGKAYFSNVHVVLISYLFIH